MSFGRQWGVTDLDSSVPICPFCSFWDFPCQSGWQPGIEWKTVRNSKMGKNWPNCPKMAKKWELRSFFYLFAILEPLFPRFGPRATSFLLANLNFGPFSILYQAALSGPVLRDTARLSQRYPPIVRYGVFGVSPWPNGCDTPSPFSKRSPIESMQSGGAIPPPQKGYLSDTCAIAYENKAHWCDTPLCDTISKGYCAIWGGISHWAAKRPPDLQDFPFFFGIFSH